MAQTVVSAGAAGAADCGTPAEPDQLREQSRQALRWMLLARVLEEKLAAAYRAGKVCGGVYLGKGQEALSVSVGLSLRRGDVFAPLIRDTAGRLAFGEPILDLVRNYFGSALGPMRGHDGNVHVGRPREGILPMVSHLGAMISVVNGVLMAHRWKGISGTVGAASLGDGGTSTGAFHEAMNQAAVEKLPLVLVIANNQYAYSTPTSRQFACRSLADRALGYGVEGYSVDGTDLAACLSTVGEAVNRARQGRGPQMVVDHLLRLSGHGEHDDASSVDPQVKVSPAGRDCLAVAEENLRQKEWADQATFERWRAEAVQQVETAMATVEREPGPNPFEEAWCALASKHLQEVSSPVPS